LQEVAPVEGRKPVIEYRCHFHQGYHIAYLEKVRKITRPHQPKNTGLTSIPPRPRKKRA
jgi:hypothetical protein